MSDGGDKERQRPEPQAPTWLAVLGIALAAIGALLGAILWDEMGGDFLEEGYPTAEKLLALLQVLTVVGLGLVVVALAVVLGTLARRDD